MNLDEQLIEQETNMAGVESEDEDSSDILDGQEQEQEEQGEQQGGRSSSFKAWFENDRNVIPSKRIPYLMMMMSTIDPSFSLDAPPFTEAKKFGLRPTLKMYKTEVKRRDPKARSSRNQPELLQLLRDDLALTDPEDIKFIKLKVDQHKQKLCQLAAEKSAKVSCARTTFRSIERMRFVECMVLDEVKPLYLKVHEVMERHELDGRNSDRLPPDFYEVITQQFNNKAFVPMSRRLPHLHERLADAIELPLEDGVLMTPEHAQKLIRKMKGPLAKLVSNYDRSGNGDGMRGEVEDDDDSDAAEGTFDLTNVVEGSNIGSFLQQNDPFDVLYWWHVLNQAQMLDYTISILPDAVGATSDDTPSVLSNTSEKVKNTEFAQQISVLAGKLDDDNVLKRQAHIFHRERMKFDQESFKKKMDLEHGRDNFDRTIKKRDLEREVEGFEDELDAMADGTNPTRKKRLEERIEKLKTTISNLDKK